MSILTLQGFLLGGVIGALIAQFATIKWLKGRVKKIESDLEIVVAALDLVLPELPEYPAKEEDHESTH